MTKYFKTMREALHEARQFRDPKVDLKVVKNNKVIVIDKSDWPTFKAKGWLQAESTQVNEARYEVDVNVGYKGIGSFDDVTIVVNAKNEDDAEDVAYNELDKLRSRRKFGPGGGGGLEEFEVRDVTKTNQSLGLKSAGREGP